MDVTEVRFYHVPVDLFTYMFESDEVYQDVLEAVAHGGGSGEAQAD